MARTIYLYRNDGNGHFYHMWAFNPEWLSMKTATLWQTWGWLSEITSIPGVSLSPSPN